ncbi:MAG: class I SAM-dependent methyltransferase [Gammaproteobacteria bacterium]|nr:class I SAM-dependent methyltransferase [Gammaproteobacteria bacterium]
MMDTETLQKKRFDTTASDYAAHHGDKWSQKYYKRFIYEPMFENISLKNLNVLEAMCGSGEATAFLNENGAFITGLDISKEEIDIFKTRWPDSQSYCRSILNTELPENSFDCVMIIGGLHHVHPHVDEAIQEIYRILKPDGFLCFSEPHKGSLPDKLRKIWYNNDKTFAENEESIDIEHLKVKFSKQFNFKNEYYKGNFAYIFVLQSLVLRIPLKLKAIYSPLLIWLEGIFDKIQGKSLSCFVVCQWQKK